MAIKSISENGVKLWQNACIIMRYQNNKNYIVLLYISNNAV
jgi:hypothetical protein